MCLLIRGIPSESVVLLQSRMIKFFSPLTLTQSYSMFNRKGLFSNATNASLSHFNWKVRGETEEKQKRLMEEESISSNPEAVFRMRWIMHATAKGSIVVGQWRRDTEATSNWHVVSFYEPTTRGCFDIFKQKKTPTRSDWSSMRKAKHFLQLLAQFSETDWNVRTTGLNFSSCVTNKLPSSLCSIRGAPQ